MNVTVQQYLQQIEEEDRSLFMKLLQPKLLTKGEHYVREGQYVNTIAFIQEGYIRTYQIDYQGNDTTLDFHGPNTFCGSYYGFYTHQKALDNLEAITDCRVALLTYDHLMSMYERSLNINILGRKIIEQVCINKDLRIAKMLQSNAEQRYVWFTENYPDLLPVAQQRHIASFLGIQPETLSRIRRKLMT